MSNIDNGTAILTTALEAMRAEFARLSIERDTARERVKELTGVVDQKLDELQKQARIVIDLRSQVRALECERDTLAQRVAALEANAELPFANPKKSGVLYAVCQDSELFDTPENAIAAAYEYDDEIDGHCVIACTIDGRISIAPAFIPEGGER